MSAGVDRLPRLLNLVPFLLANPDRPVGEVAREFGVSESQLRKDLDLIFVCGLPGHGPGDLMEVNYTGDRVSLANADTIARPLRLSADEALALVVALRTLADVPGLRDGEAVARALAKIEAAAGESARGGQAVQVAVDADPDVLATVNEALAAGRRLHLRYYVPARDETTERDVDPMRVVIVDGRPYLEGFCRRVEDVRTFRLDRVLAVEVLDVAAEVPADVHPRDLSDGVFSPSPDYPLVTLDLAPEAAWVADYYVCESVEEAADGHLTVTLRAADDRWLRRLALGLGGALRVLDPPELAALLRTDAAAALSAYTESADS